MSPSFERARVAVLLSGRGSNLQALIQAQQQGVLPIELVGVASDRPDAAGLQHARAAGIPIWTRAPREYPDKAAYEADLRAAVDAFRPDWLVLAGYMRILGAATVEHWGGRLINIHPSLLPRHPGLHTHARVLTAGESLHGASVHFVTPVLDGGPVLMQVSMPMQAGDDEHSLAARLLPLEHRLLTRCIALLAAGRVVLREGRIHLDGQPLPAPLQLGAEDGVSIQPEFIG